MIQRQSADSSCFLPHRADPAQGVRVSADLTPLELLQIAAIPDREGYEVVLIDAMIHDDYEKRILEACDGALCFASSCILGYQITQRRESRAHGPRALPKCRSSGAAGFERDAGALPQGEHRRRRRLGQGGDHLWEVVSSAGETVSISRPCPASRCGRDGRMLMTAHRAIVGFDQIPDVPWHLLEFERYVERQNNTGRMKCATAIPTRGACPATQADARVQLLLQLTVAPEPCTFCCSPIGTSGVGKRSRASNSRARARDARSFQVQRACAFRTRISVSLKKRSNESAPS